MISKKVDFIKYASVFIKKEILVFLKKDVLNKKYECFILNIDNDELIDYEKDDSYQLIKEIIDNLDERRKGIIKAYFGIDVAPSMQKELAVKYGLTQANISIMIKNIINDITLEAVKTGAIELPQEKINKLHVKKRRYISLYEHFSNYSHEEIDSVLRLLSESEKELLWLRYGDDLDHPIFREMEEKDSVRCYGVLIPKIGRLLSDFMYRRHCSQNKYSHKLTKKL